MCNQVPIQSKEDELLVHYLRMSTNKTIKSQPNFVDEIGSNPNFGLQNELS